eukprot:jgi/Mesvir1/13145/Mv06114-RA.1
MSPPARLAGMRWLRHARSGISSRLNERNLADEGCLFLVAAWHRGSDFRGISHSSSQSSSLVLSAPYSGQAGDDNDNASPQKSLAAGTRSIHIAADAARERKRSPGWLMDIRGHRGYGNMIGREIKLLVDPPEQPAGIAGVKAVIYKDTDLGFSKNVLPDGPKAILRRIKAEGYMGMLVGGSVRDLSVGRTPKDYDLVVTASLSQLRKWFYKWRCMIVGKHHRIAVIATPGHMVEVSSLAGSSKELRAQGYVSVQQEQDAYRRIADAQRQGREGGGGPGTHEQMDVIWCALMEDAYRRDFTVNGMFYDPLKGEVYDFCGAREDAKKHVVRTIADPAESFTHDPVRLLRAVRVAGRMGFRLECHTAEAMKAKAMLVAKIPQTRRVLEMQALFGYGAAASSLQLLWDTGMIPYLLPRHARLLHPTRCISEKRPMSSLVFMLLQGLDSIVDVDHPAEAHLWVALLALPLAVERTGRIETLAALQVVCARVLDHTAPPAAAVAAVQRSRRSVAELLSTLLEQMHGNDIWQMFWGVPAVADGRYGGIISFTWPSPGRYGAMLYYI